MGAQQRQQRLHPRQAHVVVQGRFHAQGSEGGQAAAPQPPRPRTHPARRPRQTQTQSRRPQSARGRMRRLWPPPGAASRASCGACEREGRGRGEGVGRGPRKGRVTAATGGERGWHGQSGRRPRGRRDRQKTPIALGGPRGGEAGRGRAGTAGGLGGVITACRPAPNGRPSPAASPPEAFGHASRAAAARQQRRPGCVLHPRQAAARGAGTEVGVRLLEGHQGAGVQAAQDVHQTALGQVQQ